MPLVDQGNHVWRDGCLCHDYDDLRYIVGLHSLNHCLDRFHSLLDHELVPMHCSHHYHDYGPRHAHLPVVLKRLLQGSDQQSLVVANGILDDYFLLRGETRSVVLDIRRLEARLPTGPGPR